MKKFFYLISCIFLSFCGNSSPETELPVIELLSEFENITEFPILAWMGVPERETSLERFKELKESGININFSPYSNIGSVQTALDIALKAGVKLLPWCPELWTKPEKTAKRLREHPALAGYRLADEPCSKDFSYLEKWVKQIQLIDHEHGCYINLFPNYASQKQLFCEEVALEPEKDPYREYIDTFLKKVPVPFISFDHYPIYEIEGGVRILSSNWYNNLEIIAKASANAGVPFWAFARSVSYNSSPVPTTAELRLQMFSNLAYGAQCLQYFTYWHSGSSQFHDPPIDLDGNRTVVYERIQSVNREIHSYAHVFLGAKLISVWHTGEQIPEGTRRIDKLPEHIKLLNTEGNGAVVSLLEKEKHFFLVVVNRDFQNSMKLSISTDKSVKKVLKDRKSITLENNSEILNVDPGDITVYAWNK